MDPKTHIYVEFSPELKAQLGNSLNLTSILEAANIEADIKWKALPPAHPEERSKALIEVVTLVVSVAAAIKLVESAITHYLDHKAVRNSHFAYSIPEPMVDAKGKPVLDKNGEPRTIRRQISGFDAFPLIPGEAIIVSVGQKGVSMDVGQQGLTQEASADKET